MKKLALFVVGLLMATSAMAADMYTIDTAHSNMGFFRQAFDDQHGLG